MRSDMDVSLVERYDTCNTSLTISNLSMRDVGAVLEALREAGFEVELNLSRFQGEQ